MTDLEILQIFCATIPFRYDMRTPFAGKDGFLYATNGHICVRCPGELLLPEPDRQVPSAWDVFQGKARAHTGISSNWKAIKSLNIYTRSGWCGQCNGFNRMPPHAYRLVEEVEFEIDEEFDCEVCGGSGRMVIESWVEIFGRRIQTKYYRLVKGTLGDMPTPVCLEWFCPPEPDKVTDEFPVYFRAGRFEGAVMPLKRGREDRGADGTPEMSPI